MNQTHSTVSISVMSGKGGVGKTNLTLNLGYALYELKRTLMLIDCDLGLANLDVLLGISPEKNLQDLLRPDIDARNVLCALEKGGLDFLPAASGVPELVEMDEDLRDQLLRRLNHLFRRYNYLLLDLGAGISSTVLSFAAMSRARVIVLTPEPTSLTDSYALMKVLATRKGVRDFFLVINQVSGNDETKKTYSRIRTTCERFLGISPHLLGQIRHDTHVLDSVCRQIPLLRYAPSCPASQDIMSLARKIDSLRTRMLPGIAGKEVFDLEG
ncbi:MAG: MinD/ParA family protein [Desulfovibrionales bacterium]